MYNGQNNQNSGNQPYGNSSNNYQYNNGGVPQNNGMMGNQTYYNQNQGYVGGQVPQYTYPQNQNYAQYQQQSQLQANYQYGSNLNNIPNKNGKKKKLILIVIIALVIVIAVVVAIFFLGKGKKKNGKVSNSNSNGTKETSYEEIIKQYGTAMETQISDYKEESGNLPTKDSILESTKIEGYQIECETVEIYSTGKVHLDKCSINGSEETYSYGEESNEEAILNEYGKKSVEYVSNYFKINNGLPNNIDIQFDAKIECETVKIYDAETLYLENCTINGSSKKYSYGYPKEDGYVYISYTGYNNEVIGETTTPNFESNKYQKQKIKCATTDCSLDKYLGPYVAIKESDGRTILHNITSTSSLFTVANNLEYTFIAKDGTSVYGLLLRNQKGQEALYSLEENQMKQEYGKYYYVWENPNKTELWEKYSSVVTKNLLIPVKKTKDGKSGLISLKKNKEVLSFEYDTMFFDDEYLNVTKNGKRGLISSDGDRILLGGNFYEEFVLANYQSKYVMVYDNDQLQVLNLDGKLIKKVAEIPRGYVLMNGDGYTGMKYNEEKGKAIFTILFRTDKQGNPCAKYTYNLTDSKLNIDENKCESFQG